MGPSEWMTKARRGEMFRSGVVVGAEGRAAKNSLVLREVSGVWCVVMEGRATVRDWEVAFAALLCPSPQSATRQERPAVSTKSHHY
jgi:hypothetical protein